MTIDHLQKEIDQWITTVGVRYFNELTNLGILMEEVGELSRVMVREYGEQSYKKGSTPESMKDELADVLWVICCIANQTGVNLSEAMQENIQKKIKRDGTRHQENPKLK